MATTRTVPDRLSDRWQSNSTPFTPSSPSQSPGNTPQSPYSPQNDSNNTNSNTFPMSKPPQTNPLPITTKLIPPSMISMNNGVPLPPTISNTNKHKKNKHNYPGTKQQSHHHHNNHHNNNHKLNQSTRSRRKYRDESPSNTRCRSHDKQRSRSRSRDRNSSTNNNNECQHHYNMTNTPITTDDDDDDDDDDDEDDQDMNQSNDNNDDDDHNHIPPPPPPPPPPPIYNTNPIHSNNNNNIYDLTMNTPMTPESDTESDSDIEIIDSVVNTQNNNNNNNNNTSNNNNNSNNNVVSMNDRYNFEKYTLSGIGGKLLRKAGWDGNRESLYEKNGPIEQSTIYRSLQRNFVTKKNGLGYSGNFYMNKRQRIHRNRDNDNISMAVLPSQRPPPPPPPHFMMNRAPKPIQAPTRIRLPPQRPLSLSIASNTINTAIVLDDDEEDDMNINHIDIQRMDKRRKKKKKKKHRKRIEELDDDDVVVLNKEDITSKRLNKIPFNRIIDEMAIESEESTLKYIEKQFSGKRKIAITKMVISIKDSYSQCGIAVAVRGKFCKHLQPFDAKSFLMRPRKYQKCTQCNQCIKREHLVKSIYFQNIFDDIRVNYDDGIEQIEIMRDGTWKPVVNKERKKKEKKVVGIIDDSDNMEEEREKEKSLSVIVLSSGSDDDEEQEEEEEQNRNTYKRNVGQIINEILNRKNDDEPEVVDLLDSSSNEEEDEEDEEEDEEDDEDEVDI